MKSRYSYEDRGTDRRTELISETFLGLIARRLKKCRHCILKSSYRDIFYESLHLYAGTVNSLDTQWIYTYMTSKEDKYIKPQC